MITYITIINTNVIIIIIINTYVIIINTYVIVIIKEIFML